jgi:hypothetical protein
MISEISFSSFKEEKCAKEFTVEQLKKPQE